MNRITMMVLLVLSLSFSVLFWLPQSVVAGEYLGEYCWTYETTDNDVDAKIRLGVNHIGDNHYICSGLLDVQSPIKMKFPAFGNVEFVDDTVVLTLSLNGIRDGQIGIEMIKIELDPDTFDGSSKSFGTYIDANEYFEGTVTLVDCD